MIFIKYKGEQVYNHNHEDNNESLVVIFQEWEQNLIKVMIRVWICIGFCNI